MPVNSRLSQKTGHLIARCESRVLGFKIVSGEGREAGGGGLQVEAEARLSQFYEVAAAAAAVKPAEGTFNKSCGQFQPLHDPGFTLFIYTPRHAGENQRGQEKEQKERDRKG